MFPAGIDASLMHIWDVSYSVSETSQRRADFEISEISPGRLIKDISSEMPFQRRFWVASETLTLCL